MTPLDVLACLGVVSDQSGVPLLQVRDVVYEHYTQGLKPKKKRRGRKPLIDPELLKEETWKTPTRVVYPDGFVMEFEYNDKGQKSGWAFGHYPNGEMWGWEMWRDGVKAGPREVFHNNGNPYIKESYDLEGHLDGARQKWSQDGTLEEDQVWSHGQLVKAKVIQHKIHSK
jgi:antitoxin component YwqK of YwqJK toxin-antitoxin module